MGFFALLSEPDSGAYGVTACHVNVWSLSGLFGHRPMLFDLGVRFTATEKVTGIHVAVPVRAGPVKDLSPMLKDVGSATLIFGKTFTGASASELTLGSDTLQIVEVDEKKVKVDAEASDGELSCVSVPFTTPVHAGTEGYARLRFVADGVGDMWRWKRILMRRNGVVVDFRSPDPREGTSATNHSKLAQKAIPLKNLDVFFMLSDRFQLQVAEPKLQYIRTLEDRKWSNYLRRAPSSRLSRHRVLVYRWRVEEASSTSVFRGFMELNRHPSFRPTSDHLIQAALIVVAVLALLHPLGLRHDLVTASRDTLRSVWKICLIVVATLGGGGALVLWLVDKIRGTSESAAGVKRRLKKYVEYPFFRIQK